MAEEEAEIKLYSARFSSFAYLVQIALREKAIPFELIEEDLRNKSQGLLEANPIHKKVPALVHNGKPVSESLVILEYLEDAFPDQGPLLPKDAYERATVRFWIDYIYKSFGPISSGLRAKHGSPEKQAGNEAALAFVKEIDGAMTSFSADGPFFTGDKFSLADVALTPLYSSLVLIKEFYITDIPGPDVLPRFHKWVDVIKVRPSVISSVPTGEEFLEKIKQSFASLGLTTKDDPKLISKPY